MVKFYITYTTGKLVEVDKEAFEAAENDPSVAYLSTESDDFELEETK